ncbi:hypothetical protein T484DRAFT_1668626 [Baffinella frigidus]|nr:hypothetical protein T484DRAFT_1668626 [Cryptophyta sp. CCMP2293]
MAGPRSRVPPLAVLAWIVANAVFVAPTPPLNDPPPFAAAAIPRSEWGSATSGVLGPAARGRPLRGGAGVGAGVGAGSGILRGGGGSLEKKGFLGRTEVRAVVEKGHAGVGEEVVVCGWARTVRVQGAGKFAFLEINDGSSFQGLQVVADIGIPGWEQVEANAHAHTSWRIVGTIVESPGKGQAVEIKASSVRLLGATPPEQYPLAKGRLPLEFLRTLPHLRARSNTHLAVLRVRSRLAYSIHSFFQERGFKHVHTPIITTSDCEGAGELFQVTTLLNKESPPPRNETTGQVEYGGDFFKKRAFLTVSGQLQAEAAASAAGDVYTFGPTFRAEASHTSRHLAEFWMVEPEMAFADLTDDMDCAEAMLKHVLSDLIETLPADLAFLDSACIKGLAGFSKGPLLQRLQDIAASNFTRVSYTEAVEALQEAGARGALEEVPKWGDDLSTVQERFLCDQVYKGPVMVHDYPKDIKAFYMRQNDDGKTVAAMDVLFPNCGEMVGGSQREERLEVLEARMAAMGLDRATLAWYTDLRRFGGVPTAGFGLGFDRLVLFATGLENIRDVSAYPCYAGHAAA